MHRTFALLVLLAGCSHAIQTTSGAAFIAQGPIDQDIAAIEPNLHFPARIGVARVVNGALTLPSGDESAAFADLAETLAPLGTFVQVSPLISSMVNGDHYDPSTDDAIKDIRQTAARQHLDYVLIYEIGARSSETDTPFALADVTLIGGAFLPTRNIKVAGVGSAIFLDVRNGYPYGTVQVAEDLSGLARSFGLDRRTQALQDRATLKVFKALVPEVQAMLVALQATPR